jgi:hypothetical protein
MKCIVALKMEVHFGNYKLPSCYFVALLDIGMSLFQYAFFRIHSA